MRDGGRFCGSFEGNLEMKLFGDWCRWWGIWGSETGSPVIVSLPKDCRVLAEFSGEWLLYYEPCGLHFLVVLWDMRVELAYFRVAIPYFILMPGLAVAPVFNERNDWNPCLSIAQTIRNPVGYFFFVPIFPFPTLGWFSEQLERKFNLLAVGPCWKGVARINTTRIFQKSDYEFSS